MWNPTRLLETPPPADDKQRLHEAEPRHPFGSFLAAVIVLEFVALVSLVPTVFASPAESETVVQTQTYVAPVDISTAALERPDYGYQPGYAYYMATGTNHDWARIVLVAAGWPVTESNVTVIARWMRQENYVKSWWNRNNPLNNGWGSGGGGGLGSYSTLLDAALYAAKALKTHPGYAGIAAAFARSAPTAEIEAAIWASPWASGHYNNGAHWHYSPVEVIAAPQGAWR